MAGPERISESPATLETYESSVLIGFEVRSEPAPACRRTSNPAHLWKSPDSPSTRGRLTPNLGVVTEDEDLFELEPPAREADRLTLDLDGWEGPLDLLLTLARAQKVDLAEDLDPRSGRAISRLHRRREEAAAGDRRRLSGDGGLARLPQILPAAAQGPDGRSEPRGAGDAAAAAAAAAAGDARGGGAAGRRATGSAATSSCAPRPRG